MDAAMIGKIEKAIHYAQDPDRISFSAFEAKFKGDHREHAVSYKTGAWTCDCKFFNTRGVCSHVMTIERILAGSVDAAKAMPMPA